MLLKYLGMYIVEIFPEQIERNVSEFERSIFLSITLKEPTQV